jgi:hypothetical protein
MRCVRVHCCPVASRSTLLLALATCGSIDLCVLMWWRSRYPEQAAVLDPLILDAEAPVLWYSTPQTACWRVWYARGARCAPFQWRAAQCWGYDIQGVCSFTPSNRTFPFLFPSVRWCAWMACSRRGAVMPVGMWCASCVTCHTRHRHGSVG